MFEPKPKGDIDEFCKNFYANHILHPPNIGSIDTRSLIWGTFYDSILKGDPTFIATDEALFQHEMGALQLELFAFAWQCFFLLDKHTFPQSLFTRRYLDKENKPEYWDMMGFYNGGIALSASLDIDGKPMQGASGRGRVTFLNSYRVGLYEDWAEKHKELNTSSPEEYRYQIQCYVRIINRYWANLAWHDGVVLQELAGRLLSRLGRGTNITSEGLTAIMTIIHGLYDGAYETIKAW